MATKVITEYEGKITETKYFHFNLTREQLNEITKQMEGKNKILAYVDVENEKVGFGTIKLD